MSCRRAEKIGENREKGKVANIFTREFIQDFCGPDGEILWKKLIAFNSGEAGR